MKLGNTRNFLERFVPKVFQEFLEAAYACQQVRKKMTKEEFVRNTAGTNERTDFPRDFLEMLYSNIERRALRIPPAHQQADGVSRSSSLPEAARCVLKDITVLDMVTQ